MENLHKQLPLSGEVKFSPYPGFYVGADMSKLSPTQIMVLAVVLGLIGFCYWQKSN